MSDTSVSEIALPGLRTGTRKNTVARRVLFSLLKKIVVGEIVLHEAEKSYRFGNPGGLSAVVTINDSQAYHFLLTGGAVGAGESYMLGLWDSPDLTQVIRLFSSNMDAMKGLEGNTSWLRKLGLQLTHLLNSNTKSGSRRNISAHYDLGNDFFKLFLDTSMMYSSAVFPHPGASLEQAAEHKLDLICKQLELTPDDHLLEIGTGWGGMAVYAARHYGCRVTTTTISKEQYDYACQRVAEEGLQDKIELLCEDYRNLTGTYDKLVSIEMIEAVGAEYYSNYFNKCSSLLKPDGLMAIQAITIPDQRYEEARRSVDFIKRYIFPGGCLPSIEVISRHIARDTDMQIVHLRDITGDYAETLRHWRERFLNALPEVRQQGFDEIFERMWEFYFCYCEGGFRERIIGTVQLCFAKPGYRSAG